MTTVEQPSDVASAAASGASATERFHADKSPYAAVKDTPTERVDLLAREVIDAVHDTIRRHRVTYDEYNALKAWLIDVGREWRVAAVPRCLAGACRRRRRHRPPRRATRAASRARTTCRVLPNWAPRARSRCATANRAHPLVWRGRITDTNGAPLPGKVELWHADADGFYSQFAPGIPEWNLRGSFSTGDDGAFEITTIRPAPYQIPTDGSCGKLISAAGWHAWRPAHLHVKVSAPGHELLTAQLYFPGDQHNDDDIASAVKPELILDPQVEADGTQSVSYDFALDPEQS